VRSTSPAVRPPAVTAAVKAGSGIAITAGLEVNALTSRIFSLAHRRVVVREGGVDRCRPVYRAVYSEAAVYKLCGPSRRLRKDWSAGPGVTPGTGPPRYLQG
jgi:hypothetical protein